MCTNKSDKNIEFDLMKRALAGSEVLTVHIVLTGKVAGG